MQGRHAAARARAHTQGIPRIGRFALVCKAFRAMTAQLHALGVFVVPDATAPEATIAQALAADAAGLDIVALQDHPYQHRFFDTWTLMPYLAARTERVRLVPDVSNLPLRPPAMLAKAAASLDVLSGGRLELGLGAGGFWDAIAAMGGPRRSGKESVDALEEAIAILRAFWSDERSISFEGSYYSVSGLHPGPKPVHDIGIWLGAYGPRMLRITGQSADGWLPSLGSRMLSPEDVPARQAAVDEAARAAGRDPSEIERAVNVMSLDGGAEQLARIVADLGFTTVLVGVPEDDPVGFVRRLGEDVAPRLRTLLG
jgi:alkanesulfonate monooxygenase SsuD/methylene tetrahydromethanopterin reductase-like flavin-dependent oxidoreductase (luciferase family)